MSFVVSVAVESAVPPYEQVRGQIASGIRTGALATGERLPTIRALAADLGLSVNTVARAYTELEAEGLVVSRRRTGTIVTSTPLNPSLEAVRVLARELVDSARRDGVDGATVVALIYEALNAPERATRS